MTRHDVIVAGGGVVGASTALALQCAGFSVALIERGGRQPAFDVDTYDPRVYALAPGSVSFLEQLGVWAAVAAQRVSPYTRMEVWDRSPVRTLAFDANELAVAELGFIVEDSLLRATLWPALSQVTVHAPAQIAGVTLAASGVRVELAGGTALEGSLLVAAEGAESPLRALAGIEAQGWSYEQRAIVCHVATEVPHAGVALQRFLPDGPLALLPLADGRCSIVWSTANQHAEELLSLSDEEFLEALGEAIDHKLGAIIAASPRIAFPLKLMHAQAYVKAGFALVGDSAHVIHPLAGQGLNLGLADAQALVEVLCGARAEKKPLGTLRVLQRYERRRKSANLEVMALTEGLHRLFGARFPGLDGLRELGLTLVNRAGPLKRSLAQRAMGIA